MAGSDCSIALCFLFFSEVCVGHHLVDFSVFASYPDFIHQFNNPSRPLIGSLWEKGNYVTVRGSSATHAGLQGITRMEDNGGVTATGTVSF